MDTQSMVCYTDFTMGEWNGGGRLPYDFQQIWYKMVNLVYKILNIHLFREGFIKNNIKGYGIFLSSNIFIELGDYKHNLAN